MVLLLLLLQVLQVFTAAAGWWLHIKRKSVSLSAEPANFHRIVLEGVSFPGNVPPKGLTLNAASRVSLLCWVRILT